MKLDGNNIGFENRYWCPSPFNVTIGKFDAAVFQPGGEAGTCSDFLRPKGSNIAAIHIIEIRYIYFLLILR